LVNHNYDSLEIPSFSLFALSEAPRALDRWLGVLSSMEHLSSPLQGGMGFGLLRAALGALLFSLGTDFGPGCLSLGFRLFGGKSLFRPSSFPLDFSHLVPDNVSCMSNNYPSIGRRFLLLVHGASTEQVLSPIASAAFASASRSSTPILTTTMSRFAGHPVPPVGKACHKNF
jgi:hypothetical protein